MNLKKENLTTLYFQTAARQQSHGKEPLQLQGSILEGKKKKQKFKISRQGSTNIIRVNQS